MSMPLVKLLKMYYYGNQLGQNVTSSSTISCCSIENFELNYKDIQPITVYVSKNQKQTKLWTI